MFCPILLAILLPLAFAGDVLQLTTSTKDELSKHPIALVKYYAPWCGHCKALAPDYEKAATELKSNTPPVPLFEVNCDEESDMCKEANVGGYPTLKVYEHGEFVEDFTGDRSEGAIVSFMASRAGPPAQEITEKAEYEKLSEGAGIFITLQTEETSVKEEFLKAAKKLRNFFKFYYTKQKLLDASKDTLIKLSRPKQLETKLEENFKIYEGPFKAAEIEQWIRGNAVGLVGIRDRTTEEFFKKPLLVLYTAVNFERNPSNIRYYRNRMIMAAKESKTNVQFGLSDIQLYYGELSDMGVSVEPDSPKAVIMAEDGKVYVMEDKFGVSELKKFVNDFAAGSLTPFIKSEPIPEKQEGPVTKVVGKNFEDIVLDKSKDVLVEFYAPWCGHCKALKPKYEELAKKLSKESDVVIAAIDATANTFPPTFSVHGFPTIYWVPKNAKTNPTKYEGGRDVEDMLKFVAKSATNELTHYTREGQLKQEEL